MAMVVAFAVAIPIPNSSLSLRNSLAIQKRPSFCFRSTRVRCSTEDSAPQDEEVNDLGVKAALSMLRFYKREISPLLLSSCRYVPTCSEYSMQAYKKYGVAKGTVLTAWRLCRCNPLVSMGLYGYLETRSNACDIGGYGFDPPRWFGEGNHSVIKDEQFGTNTLNNTSFTVEEPVKEDDQVL